MTLEEAKGAIEDLRKENSDEKIANGFVRAYVDGMFTYDELTGFLQLLGFEIPEIINQLTDQQRKAYFKQSLK